MRDGWAQTTLGDLVDVNPEYLGIDHDTETFRYIDIGSVTWEKGIDQDSLATVTRAAAPGRARRVVRTGDVLVATVRPNLRALAIVPPELDGEVASTGFVVLRAGPEVLPEMIWAVVRSDGFVQAMVSRCTGSNYPAIRAADVEQYAFVLPPLVEQQRIVDLIGAFDDVMAASPVVEARATYQQLLSSYVYGPWAKEQLRSVLRLRADSERVVSSSSYRVLGVLRSGEGFIDRGDVAGDKTNYGRLMRVHANQLVYRKLTAWEGPISVAGSDQEGGYVSQEFPVFEVLPERLLPGLLRHLCRSPWLWKEMENRLVGSVQRRKRLNPEAFLSVEVPMPSVAEQEELCAGLDAALEVVTGYEAYRERLSLVRASVLESLLSGAREIPRSYDELMEEDV